MDLQEATITMALLMKKEYDFYNQHALPDTGMIGDMYRENLKQFEWLKANTREFGNRLAANPNFFEVMESWVVYISGTEGVAKNSIEEAKQTSDVDDLIDRASAVGSSIKKHLRKNGYFIVDMGAGEDGWDVGVRCTDRKSKHLCIEIMQRYNRAINLGLLSISRRFAGHSLPGLYGWDDAKKMLSSYGNSLPDIEV